MYAEASQKKMSHVRVSFALLCGLAVCCSVMYITADGSDIEYVQEIIKGKDAGTSVGSTDILKSGQIYTETPDGRMRLMDYFNNVEKEIADEVANRKADIASVRAQMARDFAFNAAARSKLKRDMLHKMAINAKIARRNLDRFMRHTQMRFARYASLYNRRNKATLARDKRTLKIAAHDKREAKQHLELAVTAWQKTTNAWAAATNARIDRMNKHVAANAAQIKENAKKARKDLEVAMNEWDHKVANFRSESKLARNKLSAQFAAQSKATRAWANNKIKGFVASTAAQFNDVETKMAKNRHDIDMELRQATMRFEAALNAEKALEDKRYAETVADIAAAKKEAEEKVNAASAEFKVGLLTLSATVQTQVTKVNNRIDTSAGVVRSDAAAQAKVNQNVNAEMTRMIDLGNKRYKDHLKSDVELQKLIAKDKAETDAKLNKMAMQFNAALDAVKATLKADRAHAEKALKKGVGKLWTSFYKMQEEQNAKNLKMAEDTRRMRLDAMDAVRDAKMAFRKKIADLGKVVAANDQKADKKIFKLTGVVKANAAKSRKGREEIAALEEANKQELKTAIRKMIATGEKRAQLVEERGTKMDKDTKWLINNNINSQISQLRAETDKSVGHLAALTSEARKEMKKEMLYAIETAADDAAGELKKAIADGTKKMIAFEEKAAKTHAASALARKELAKTIEDNAAEVSNMLKDAVAADARAQTLLKQETAEKIKKTNTKISAYADAMEKQAKDARAGIEALTSKTLSEIKTQEEAANDALEKFSSEDAARQKSALEFLAKQMKIAQKESELKFGKAYERLAVQRKESDEQLAGSVTLLNDALAKQAALADSRFEKTVKDISAARKQAADEVADLRKEFATGMLGVDALVRKVEQDIVGQIGVVSGEVISMKANQYRVNKRVKEELERVETLSNKRFSDSKKARGKLKMLMDENKEAASQEVKALKDDLMVKLQKLNKERAANKLEMAKDLTGATEKFYEAAATMQRKHKSETDALNAETTAAALADKNALARAQEKFDSKIIMLTNVVAANAAKAEREITRVTGVAHDYAKADAKDRELIKTQTKSMQLELQKSLTRAIQIGEAKAKAVEERIAEHLKQTKQYLMVELSESTDRAADDVFKLLTGKRQKIADNYLSLKAYAVSAADKIADYVGQGKGRGLSSIGDMLQTIAAIGAVKAPKAEGAGFGSSHLTEIFSGKTMKVPNAVAKINGLVNEFTMSAKQVRERWPMGLGKYLLDKLEESMMGKGVLQVDKVDGKAGNFVFLNGHSVGLSNKLSDFATLAARMTTYEDVLAKLTSKLTAGPHNSPKVFAKPPEWQGN
jgi:hypothetical protein